MRVNSEGPDCVLPFLIIAQACFTSFDIIDAIVYHTQLNVIGGDYPTS